MTRLVALTSTGQVSGAERVLLRTLAAAVAAGWDVECLAPAGPLEAQVAATGARHREIPELGLAGRSPVAVLRTLVRWLRTAWLLRRTARGADVVLVNSLLALPALRLAGRTPPAAWLAHDVVVAPGRLRLYRLCRSALTTVVGVSAAVVDRLRDGDHGDRGDRGPALTVVHNGVVPPDLSTPLPEPVSPPVVGLNGLLTPWKGQQVLLDAAWMLPPGTRVELLGGQLPTDADYGDRVRARLDGTPLGEQVTVVGHLDDPLARMRGWSVAVSASTDPEACPLAVLEAMSLGIPVVATDHGGAPEVLAGAGLLVPAGDARALAEAVTRLLDDPDLRNRCAVRGRERVATGHDLAQQTDLLLHTLLGIAGRDHSDARGGAR
ncbi:glycosyltransferase family 4 protein [Nocardioides rubriscoriae]|uniref:glycosyltransferase family 4 protein n=1 Tax=Nocardioides rubriscoriae TaxID=642762 RepID=UPI0011DFAA8D|nr:glycosyltransferase family 4 protein [Nocardioides rubriscoriae]